MTLDELRALAAPNGEGDSFFPAPYLQMSVTLEEAELLFALVAAIKPLDVLELGSGLGLSGFFLASALPENGVLTTVEPDDGCRAQTKTMLANLPVEVIAETETDLDWDLVYIDSGYQYRAHNIRQWLTNGYEGLVVVHDADRRYEELELGRGVFLPTSAGMWIGRAA